MPIARVRRLLGSPDDSSNGVWSYGVDRETSPSFTCVYLSFKRTAGRLQHAEVGRDQLKQDRGTFTNTGPHSAATLELTWDGPLTCHDPRAIRDEDRR